MPEIGPAPRLLEMVRTYLASRDWSAVPELAGQNFTVSHLAHGEYNCNFLLEPTGNPDSSPGPGRPLVFRVNLASQIGRRDQILYEFSTLKMLTPSGCTPRPIFTDDSRAHIPHGIGIMEYLAGGPLDYRKDLEAAAKTFARIHSTTVQGPGHLIEEKRVLSLIFNECSRLLESFLHSPLADIGRKRLFSRILAALDSLRGEEQFFDTSPARCVVNTEVNSGNFIANRRQNTLHLIDWEMARWGDPSSDLCHFCSPLTTLWKTDYRMDEIERTRFLDIYGNNLERKELGENLTEKFQRKYPFVLLRGISWSAMAWTAYQTEYDGIRNEDTWKTLNRYLDETFIRSLFKPYLP